MSDTEKLFPTTELAGAIATNGMDNATLKIFSADPKGEILANTNVDFADIDIKLIENSGNDINLILPYYSEISEIQAIILNDKELKSVSAGEIVFVLTVFFGMIGTACGIGAFTAGGTFTTAAVLGGIAVSAAVAGGATAAVGGVATAIGTGVHYGKKGK